MAKRSDQFQTIRTEGAILPPDILQSIASLKVDGVSPESYHLPPGTKLNEAIAHSWSVLQKHWKGFQEARQTLDANATGTETTNKHWLLPLFEELKYGRLTTSKSPEIDGRTYAIERFYAGQPIHLIGCNLPLDRRTEGARGAASARPHSMVQEFLNRTEENLWGFLSNGLMFRILRDNVSLSRQAYVEFDLEAMMEGEIYPDFALLWMLCHQSRVEADKPQEFWLEKWSQLAREQGTRVLADLRNGVAKAIEALGRGFIAHPRNDKLREKLHSGQLDTQEYYRQLLRIIYRLLFLFVAEDRRLLHPPDADPDACELYDTYYSTRRLRELADQIRGSKHADLWHTLSLVFDSLSCPDGCAELGLPALGSFLWRRSSTSDLLGPAAKEAEPVAEPALITNHDLLTAVRALAYVVQDKARRAVDYRNLGSEELGSVYESLLELHPTMNAQARTFELSIAAGHERKTTGSYYTPDSLVQCLLDSALEPVVEDRLKGKKGDEAVQALLDIKVCDPASGNGHFLIAAAHRLARHLARIRTGESEPSPNDYQHALRDVIGRCIYGVDINPMAVELCKVSLWMEAIEPGKPLSFLDHHIQCGNSLLGTTPALLANGIPDEAFKAIEGDVKERVNALKKENKRERQDYESGQCYLFAPTLKLGNLPAIISQINVASEESVEDVAAKQEMYEKLVKGADYLNVRLLADTWCAAFVWKKDDSDLGRLCPTERGFRSIEDNPHSILPYVKSAVRRLASQYKFFHWHLAFPDVFRLPEKDKKAENQQTGWDGGFDVVLGNPPWERIKLQEKEWFVERALDVANAQNSAARRQLIAALERKEPQLFVEFKAAVRLAESQSAFIRNSGRYPLCGRGDVNTYSIFAELNRGIICGNGELGCLFPSGLATDDTTKLFFQDLTEKGALKSFFEFENEGFFAGAGQGHMVRFALTTIVGTTKPATTTEFMFQGTAIGDISSSGRVFELSVQDINAINPNTRTCPIFKGRQDAEITKLVYKRFPVLIRENNERNDAENPWGISFLRMFDMANDSKLFKTNIQVIGEGWTATGNSYERNGERLLPLYEAKMAYIYTHRHGSFPNPKKRAHVLPATEVRDLQDPNYFATPFYWVPNKRVNERLSNRCSSGWLLGWRDVTDARASARTTITSVIPRVGVNDKFLLMLGEPETLVQLYGILASFAFDYIARQKVAGLAFKYFTMKQMPVLTPELLSSPCTWVDGQVNAGWLCNRLLELTYTAWDLEAFALDCGYDGPPFRWDGGRRFLLRCELDAAYFHLYLESPKEWSTDSPQLREMFPTPRDAVEYIMETFPIVKRKDIKRTQIKNDAGEVITPGTYITKDTILEIYDEMAEAIRTGHPYQTRVDPPPGPPIDAEGNFIPIAEWHEFNWPEHIHPPQKEATT